MAASARGARVRALLAITLSSAIAVAGCTADDSSKRSSPETAPKAPPAGVPQVTPQPHQVDRLGGDIPVHGKVELVTDPMVDAPTRDLAVRVLREAGAGDVVVRPPGQRAEDATLRVRLGDRVGGLVVKGLQEVGYGAPFPLPPEGYVVAGKREASTLVLGASDPSGAYYAVQTLRQLVSPGSIAGVGVVDHPSMPSRGAIEGFYGTPWTHQERMDQLAFYGEQKLNTYVYAPKDDPYHREQWRDPYPPDKLAQVRELIGQAKAHHVRFTFALSPGNSICFSDPGDRSALIGKLQRMYDSGVRDFSIPFDDISYTKWNCPQDQAAYGAPSSGSAGRAQADLLNRVQHEFLDKHPGTQPLQTVPTEYSDMDESQYKAALRGLDPRVQTMWTGDGVIPKQITVDDAERATQVWGRKPLLWDNFPVNDFKKAQGRLLLGPYDKREPGLSKHMVGDLVNPMPQAAASKVAEVGAADFAWNDAGFDPRRAWRAAAEYLAGKRTATPADPATVRALLAFFDLNYMSPVANGSPWQGPAPELARRLDQFRAEFEGGDQRAALTNLRDYARTIADAPERIRQGAAKDFAADAGPWLESTDLWGDALLATVDGLQARADRDPSGGQQHFATASELASRAGQVPSTENRTPGPVHVGDGVLDVFIRQAPDM